MDRVRVWLAVSPLVAGGVLVAHTLAYRLTGTPTGSLHAYLDHAPQILVVLTLVTLAFAGLGARLGPPSAWPFPAAALATFVVQEHVERVAHTGDLPWLLDSPAFAVGALLQLPVALFVWMLARRLLAALQEPRVRPPRLPRVLLEISRPPTLHPRALAAVVPRGRGPPLLHTP